jgi:hypothetical protein
MLNLLVSETWFAKVAELVDAPDLGSGALKAWGFESPLSHRTNKEGE